MKIVERRPALQDRTPVSFKSVDTGLAVGRLAFKSSRTDTELHRRGLPEGSPYGTCPSLWMLAGCEAAQSLLRPQIFKIRFR